jgi:hypothetical protein
MTGHTSFDLITWYLKHKPTVEYWLRRHPKPSTFVGSDAELSEVVTSEMSAREQFGGRLRVGIKAGTRRLLKRAWSKSRRQEEKKSDDPPRRPRYAGWYD